MSTSVLHSIGEGRLIAGFVASGLLYVISRLAYNLWFHPLAKYPGPLLARATPFWYIRSMIRGRLPFDVAEMHERYGEAVRIKPDELSFITPEAWKEIYGYRSGKSENPKDPSFFKNIGSGHLSIVGALGERHGQLRRLLSHGFSEKSLRAQESTIQRYADMLIQRLHEASAEGTNLVNMVQWYNFFTFDLIGDLAYGESFECLSSGAYHPWVTILFGNIRFGVYSRVIGIFPQLGSVLRYFIPKQVLEDRKNHVQTTNDKAFRRREKQTTTYDLVYRMADKDSGVSDAEFAANTSTLILAGSETTATLLSGVTYWLAMNPRPLEKLVNEIRSTFDSEDQIDCVSVNKLKYMLACLDEAARIYPPVAGGMPRVALEPMTIGGRPVPKDTVFSVYQWAAYHSERNFKSPMDYIPERWVEGENGEFKGDSKQVLQPFSIGPRNCIGRNLAYVEMRLVLARVLFNFDLEATAESKDWGKQNVYLLWEKPPLLVRLKPAMRSPHKVSDQMIEKPPIAVT